MLCKLLSKYGKVHAAWLGDNRLKTNTLTSFSGIILNLVPVIMLFLETFHADKDELVDVTRCYKLMHTGVGIMNNGSEVAPRFATKLQELLTEFHTLFALISPSIKLKLHHMRHVI